MHAGGSDDISRGLGFRTVGNGVARTNHAFGWNIECDGTVEQRLRRAEISVWSSKHQDWFFDCADMHERFTARLGG